AALPWPMTSPDSIRVDETPLHEVITFYSYKGGTGRTMALANVACLLAKRLPTGQRVLAIDWDLEAPGLHYYLNPPVGTNVFPQRPGIIELFTELSQLVAARCVDGDEDAVADEVMSSIRVEDFICETSASNVDLMPAGCMDDTYQARL